MIDAEWKNIGEKLSLLLTGAGAAFALQKLYRSITGAPPCEPEEADKMILAEIGIVKGMAARINERLSEVEKIAKPSPSK